MTEPPEGGVTGLERHRLAAKGMAATDEVRMIQKDTTIATHMQ